MEELRRELRKQLTDAEAILWSYLRSNQLGGRKFRRQHSVGSYVLDFYCTAERLAIEVDGSVHQQPENLLHDQERDDALANLGIRTIRIKNDEVEADISSVLQRISEQFVNNSH
ncbi:endonuclease domain-containing protein [Spirosoma montaniterrae]|nr:endonuclease domain-containing protein [Spirosoma montaniterrae]